ncbi:MAG: hypothetical protein IJG37_00525, partial [Synergistaceae bacterium]|nr:hypothetical protein [Synergistaceae bacterium]
MLKRLAARIVLAVLLSWAFYSAIDYFALHNWNNNDSLIVRVIEAGPESVIPFPEGQDQSDA